MVGPPEQQQEGVATELQQAAAPIVRNGEHLAEHIVEDLGELFSPDPAPPGQLLGQRCEAGDVDVAESAVDLLPRSDGASPIRPTGRGT